MRSLLPALLSLAPLMAQQSPAQIGVFLWHDSPNDRETLHGIERAFTLAGQKAQFVQRNAQTDERLAQEQLAELRALRPSLLLALGTKATLLAKAQVPDLPIVFAAVTDPVASGILPTYQGATGNLCGASSRVDPATVLRAFRLAVPHMAKLGMLCSQRENLVSRAEFAALQAHLREPNAPELALFSAEIPHNDQVEPAVQALLAQGVDAVWVPIDLPVYQNLATIRKALAGQQVPLVTTAAAALGNGALVGVVPNYALHGERAGAMALSVLAAGNAPSRLAVDRMRSCLLKVDLAAARRSGIELPLSLLAVADELLVGEPDGRR